MARGAHRLDCHQAPPPASGMGTAGRNGGRPGHVAELGQGSVAPERMTEVEFRPGQVAP